jgi:hypothetical protein
VGHTRHFYNNNPVGAARLLNGIVVYGVVLKEGNTERGRIITVGNLIFDGN